VLENTKKFKVRSGEFYGGAELRRCNRSRGFSTNFARHRSLRDNYRIFQGLIYKSFIAQLQWRRRPLLAQIPAILATGERGNWWKRKRRGRGFDSIPYPRRRCIVEIEFRGGRCKGGSVHLFWAAGSSILVALVLGDIGASAAPGGAQAGEEEEQGRRWRGGDARAAAGLLVWRRLVTGDGSRRLQTHRGAGGTASGALATQAAGAKGGGTAGAARHGKGRGAGGKEQGLRRLEEKNGRGPR
jgi:hypothetical protein